MKQFDLIAFTLTPDFSPVIGNARTLKAVSTASRMMGKPLKRFSKNAARNSPG
jgi:hypothetical protein